MTEEPELERWQSEARGSFGIARFDGDGGRGVRNSERHFESIHHKDEFFITPTERRRNQQLTRDKRDDPFTNGAFKMLECVESDKESKEALAKNEAKNDAELVKILESMQVTFNKKLKVMKDFVTVERLYRLARENNIGGEKLAVLKDKLKQLDPQIVLIGDQLATGAENPDLQNSGPAANVPDVEAESAPRVYADS